MTIAACPWAVRGQAVSPRAKWLFAFDSAGIATYRALWLVATHPRFAEQAWDEAAAPDAAARHPLPRLRAAILESVRLWPTTPMIIRETTRETAWEQGVMPAHTGVLIYAPFFHRDDERLPFADRFAPELWLDGQGTAHWPLVPSSAGPAECPGRNLVLLLGSALLASVGREQRGRLRALAPQVRPRLPGTLNYFMTEFAIGASS